MAVKTSFASDVIMTSFASDVIMTSFALGGYRDFICFGCCHDFVCLGDLLKRLWVYKCMLFSKRLLASARMDT